MDVLGRILGVVIGVALLVAIGFGAWQVFQGTVAVFAGLDPQVATVTGIACLVALTSAWWIAHSLRTATRQNRQMALREEKTAAYQLFVDYWQSRLREQAMSDARPASVSEKLQVLDRLLALYGAAAVIRAHTELRDLDSDARARHAELRVRFGKALVDVRRDLGADAPGELARDLERLLLPASSVTLAPSA